MAELGRRAVAPAPSLSPSRTPPSRPKSVAAPVVAPLFSARETRKTDLGAVVLPIRLTVAKRPQVTTPAGSWMVSISEIFLSILNYVALAYAAAFAEEA